MDTIDTIPATATVINDEVVAVDTTPTTDSFGKEVTKTLATSIAITAGVVAVTFVAGFAAGKVQQIRARRAASKENPTVVEGEIVDDIPETVTTEK